VADLAWKMPLWVVKASTSMQDIMWLQGRNAC